MRTYCKPVEHNGIAYFRTLEDARSFEHEHTHAYPESRPVGYERGWAIQLRKGGDYLGANGQPSMSNRLSAFFTDTVDDDQSHNMPR